MHQYLINRWNKLLIWPGLFLISANLLAQEPKGLIESFLVLNDISTQNTFSDNYQLTPALDDIQNFDSLKISVDHLNQILFHTPANYLVMGSKDKCSFYDLLLAGHLRDAKGELTNLLVTYENKNKEQMTKLININYVKDVIIPKICPGSDKLSKYFNAANVLTTVSKFKLVAPETKPSCIKSIENFSQDPAAPYFCKMTKVIDNIPTLRRRVNTTKTSDYKNLTNLKSELLLSEKIQKAFNPKALGFLQDVCLNLETPNIFCHQYFEKGFWEQALESKKNLSVFKTFCPKLDQFDSPPVKAMIECAQELSRNSEQCRYQSRLYPGLVPNENCDQIAKLMTYSKIFNEFNDCPGLDGNAGVTNLGRILNQLSPPDKKTRYSHCSSVNAAAFAKFNTEITGGEWGVQLCYEDKINEKEVCLPTLLGDVDGSDLSISKVVAKILEKTKGTDSNLKCEVVEKASYKPVLLKFKSGCFIVYDQNTCSAVDCQTKIIFDEKEMTHITQRHQVLMDYTPSSFLKEKLSQINLIRDAYQNKNNKVQSVGRIQRIFAQYDKSIIHGIGCAEELLPSFFSVKTLNQCTPLPFIIDGMIESNGRYGLITRTALDQINTPRLLSWSLIFSAVKTYQTQHPLKLWSLYAIY